MARRLLATLTATAILGAGCGGGNGGDDGAPATAGKAVGSEPVTIPVGVDARTDGFGASFFAFFPNEVTARPGDTVEFTSFFSGEPHTVALGTMVDQALAAYSAVPAGAEAPPEAKQLLAKLPSFYPPNATAVDVDPAPSAAQPCFLESGEPPAQEACSGQQREQPDFNGRQSFFSSGFLPDEATFDVKIAADAVPGTHSFMSLVDGRNMTGRLSIVAAGKRVASPAEVRQQGQDRVDRAVASLAPRAAAVKAIVAPDAAVAGAPAEAPGSSAQVEEFETSVNAFPDAIAVATGGAVTWTINGAHTVSFNAPEDSRPLYAVEGDGIVRANKKGFGPAGGPGQGSGAPPGLVYGGQFDGSGFHSSGILVGKGVSYRLTFTKPGTYKYRCNFHTDMEGAIKVG